MKNCVVLSTYIDLISRVSMVAEDVEGDNVECESYVSLVLLLRILI